MSNVKMYVGKIRIDRYLPKRFYQRRIAPIFDRNIKEKREPPRLIINVNNFCNLRCFSCSSLCDRPFKSGHVFRDKPRHTSLQDFELYLKLTEEFNPGWCLRYTGGEPTMDPIHLNKMLRIGRDHGRFNSLLTNGANLLKVDVDLCDEIILDEHGSLNKGTISGCIVYLTDIGHPNWSKKFTELHYYLDGARREVFKKASTGPGQCWAFINSISLWEETVYPCCVLYQLEAFDDNPRVGESLRKAGWTIHNPDLLDTIENYRETIPGEALRTCLFRCWRGGYDKTVRRPVEDSVLNYEVKGLLSDKGFHV